MVNNTRHMAIYETRAPKAKRPLEFVELGPGIDAEVERRLLGEVSAKRVLDLGCGAGHSSAGLARRGARVTAVDTRSDQVDAARSLASRSEVAIEFHQAELAELAFITADEMDLAISVGALSFVNDLDRVFRQVHRVLKPSCRFVMSVPHPATLCADPVDAQRSTRRWDHHEPLGERWIHRAEDLVGALLRANFEIDALLERHGPDLSPHPATLIVRGQKLGA